jgi:hypothetical protein
MPGGEIRIRIKIRIRGKSPGLLRFAMASNLLYKPAEDE